MPLSFDGYPVSEVNTEDADPTYRKLLADIQDIMISTGGVNRFQDEETGRTACRNDAFHENFYYNSLSDKGVPENKWDQTISEITTLLDNEGFTEYNTFNDKPGEHEMAIIRPDGTIVSLKTNKATVVSVTTACHPLPADETDKP